MVVSKSKIMKVLLVLVALSILAACGGKIENRKDWQVGDFEYTNQEGETFSSTELEGEIWVADIIYTECTTECPLMTFNMQELQKRAADEGLDVQFVSFSIDPEVDTPEVLKEYGKKFNADFSNWNFLTGYAIEDIKEFAQNSFKTIADNDPGSGSIIHTTPFYLVDKEGKVAQAYPGKVDVPYDQIIEDIKVLTKE